MYGYRYFCASELKKTKINILSIPKLKERENKFTNVSFMGKYNNNTFSIIIQLPT